ncbi:tripartite tricarboxylate transporter substrate binding protein [Sulfitobacter sp. F26204]|uniref:Bug family tripartite tricarboxylate transporter substrate binding protein n=1 Tax=Sulfitobacter sp. F26204 TaxID=2996014 RepID=UPI00225E0797|nr:tripartite tricarboxylate transporter substrate binding protein [Sulfitobacter sp. F26204]MCX7560615.1 tripartite tricarboxylate transporter substrate binding protein [Sulfitobacter sp. F26204]
MFKLKGLAAAAVFGIMSMVGPVFAESWPSKNITMIVPFGAGGSIDRFARGLAQHWENNLDGVSIIVENRPGASGLLGAKTFLNAPADGHTLFVGIQPTLSMNTVVQNADFSLDDFAFVNFEQRDFGDVVVSASSRFNTIEDFVSEARAKPGELSVAMILGGGTSLFGLALLQELDLDVRIVTFDSGGALRTNMLGNHSDATISGAYGDRSLGDQVKVLAVASPEPFPGLDGAAPVAKAFEGLNIPQIGDSRFVAVHGTFAQEQPEAFAQLVESYKSTFESEVYQTYLKETGTDVISGYMGPDASTEQAKSMETVVIRFKDVLTNK